MTGEAIGTVVYEGGNIKYFLEYLEYIYIFLEKMSYKVSTILLCNLTSLLLQKYTAKIFVQHLL